VGAKQKDLQQQKNMAEYKKHKAAQDIKAKIKARLIIARKSEECEITHLPIKKLPDELWSLQSLSLLWANNNQLEFLDPAVGNLAKLQVIRLNNNLITRLPDEICNCASLVRLWLHCNRLTCLPRTMGWLFKLENLSIEQNNIYDLPYEFGRLTSLTALSYDEDKVYA
jgi:Leucine-rich repeat (LRR) protein